MQGTIAIQAIIVMVSIITDIVVTVMRQQHQLQMSHYRYSYSHVTMVTYKHIYPARQLCNVSLCVKVYKLATQQISSYS